MHAGVPDNTDCWRGAGEDRVLGRCLQSNCRFIAIGCLFEGGSTPTWTVYQAGVGVIGSVSSCFCSGTSLFVGGDPIACVLCEARGGTTSTQSVDCWQ
jgi:hypothetical protein